MAKALKTAVTWGLVLLGLLSFFGYVHLNLDKPVHTFGLWRTALKGAPADYLQIQPEAGEPISIPLPSSDLFDKAGNRQVNFFRLPLASLTQLRQGHARASYRLNGSSFSPLTEAANDHVLVRLPGRLLYLLAEDDLRGLARIAHRYHTDKPALVQCRGDACEHMMIRISGGVAELQGPFLPTDPDLFRRSLPYGRWINRSRLDLWIGSRLDTQAEMILRLYAFQSSPPVKPLGSAEISRVKHPDLRIEGNGLGTLHAVDLHLDLKLISGSNNLSLVFEDPLKTRVEHAGEPVDILLSAYLGGIRVEAPRTDP